MSFYEDTISPDHQTHALWMGSVDDGLIRYDQDTQTFSHFVPELGIAKYISCIQGDEQGYLWMGTALGLVRFDPRSETFTYFDARDGLDIGEGLSCNQGEQGEMLFGSVNGLNTFFPEQIRDNPNPPPVVITALNLNNQPLRTNLSLDDQIKLSYQENYLSFDFAALDYAAPAKNQYAYKMEGLDADWIEAGTRRHADYPALKPGSYTFRVKASNNSGVWNEQGAAVGITITPPFWQTWWFLGLISLALVGIVVGGVRLRFKGVESQNLALEEQVRERTHEIEQRHQELEALYQADAELYQHFRLDEILQALVDIAVDILHADKGSLLVWDEAKENLIVRAYNGFNPSTLASLKLKPGMGIAGKVALSGEPISVEDTALYPEVSHQITDPEGIRSFMQVPIKVRGETFGVFSADYLQPRNFNENEQRLLIAFAQRAALAIQNAQAYQKDQELAVLEERSRLARELHDAVTQTLFSASLVAEALPAAWEKDPQEGRELLQELRSLNRGALAEMRTLLLELRPAALLETSLADLLRQLGEAACGRTGIPVSVRVEGQAKLPPDVQIVFYRISQEALNNVIKHSRAHQASVQLRYSNENKIATSSESQGEPSQPELIVFLSILDDGRGFDLAAIPSNRLGLGIMQERAKAIGADLYIESQPGKGTQVTILWTQARKQEA
jgi:nitrate/nitrite-specific signal transduction histidine kinase